MSLIDKGYADGNYSCKCHACDVLFNGDKRAVTCAICAHEADLQEKLRQQREACANTYVEHHIEISPDLGYSIPCEKAILNAKIDD